MPELFHLSSDHLVTQRGMDTLTWDFRLQSARPRLLRFIILPAFPDLSQSCLTQVPRVRTFSGRALRQRRWHICAPFPRGRDFVQGGEASGSAFGSALWPLGPRRQSGMRTILNRHLLGIHEAWLGQASSKALTYRVGT